MKHRRKSAVEITVIEALFRSENVIAASVTFEQLAAALPAVISRARMRGFEKVTLKLFTTAWDTYGYIQEWPFQIMTLGRLTSRLRSQIVGVPGLELSIDGVVGGEAPPALRVLLWRDLRVTRHTLGAILGAAGTFYALAPGSDPTSAAQNVSTASTTVLTLGALYLAVWGLYSAAAFSLLDSGRDGSERYRPQVFQDDRVLLTWVVHSVLWGGAGLLFGFIANRDAASLLWASALFVSVSVACLVPPLTDVVKFFVRRQENLYTLERFSASLNQDREKTTTRRE